MVEQVLERDATMLSPVILYNVVVGIIAAMQTFAQIYILTARGPADSTLMYAYYLYISAFQFFKMATPPPWPGSCS